MSIIVNDNINKIELRSNEEERTSFSVGNAAIHPELVKIYHDQGLDSRPKTRQEALERGEKYWNALCTSLLPDYTLSMRNGKNVLTGTVTPIRYLYSHAAEILFKSGRFSVEELLKNSICQINVALISLIEENGEFFLLSQRRGNTMGSGAIHSSLAAGGVEPGSMKHSNPLLFTLAKECKEEIGIDLSYFDISDTIIMVDEYEFGRINFTFIAQNVVLDDLVKKIKINESEVASMALLPIHLEGVSEIDYLILDKNGLKRTRGELSPLRPYTSAFIEYCKSERNKEKLIAASRADKVV